MLARANLLRIRGQWSAAAEQCAQVLRLDPQSAAAHSLMGDIFLDQGRTDEAREWYEAALRLEPASAADQSKLQRVRELSEARRARAEWDAILERRQPPPDLTGTRELWLRSLAVAGAVICGLVLLAAAGTTAGNRRNPETARPPVRTTARTGTPLSSRTATERALKERLDLQGAASPLVLTDVLLGPADGTVRLRLFLPASAAGSNPAEGLRGVVLRAAYRACYRTREMQARASSIQVEVIGSEPGGEDRADLLFGATALSQYLLPPPDQAAAAEVLRAFEPNSVYWSPGIR